MTTTFAPPSPPVSGSAADPVVWGPPSPGPEPSGQLSFEPAGSPSGRRRPVVLALAVVAVVGLGVAALVALTAGGSERGVPLPEAQPFDLAAAAQTTIEARTVEFELAVTSGAFGAMSLRGAVDN
jgi:hypothetical protein